MRSPGHNVLTCGSLERELDKRKKLEKENRKGSRILFLGNLARLLVAKRWLYREPHHRTLVVSERKEGERENKKASSSKGNSGTRGHPDVLSVVRGIK